MNQTASRLEPIGLAALMVFVLAVSAYTHQWAGLTLPVPWPDEPWNLGPAIGFMEKGTIHTAYINPERPLVADAMGFPVLAGTIFKFTGFSLETARWLSWVFMAAAFVLVALLVFRRGCGWPGALATSLIFLNPTFTVCGNVGRPDTAVLAFAAAGFVMLHRGIGWPAVVVLAFGTMVHPNGLYFLVAGFIWFAAARRCRVMPTGRDWIWLALLAVAAACALRYIALHFDAFRHDFIDWRIGRKAEYQPLARTMSYPDLPWLGLHVVLLVAALAGPRRLAPVLAFGLCGRVIYYLGREMWYGIFHDIGLLSLVACAWPLARHYAARLLPRAPSLLHGAAGLAVFLLSLGGAYRGGYIEGLRGYPGDMRWFWDMRMADAGVPYFTDRDREQVAGSIREAAGGAKGGLVEFRYTADSMLFVNALPDGWVPYFPLGSATRGEVSVYRLSRYMPGWVQANNMEIMKNEGVDVSRPSYERDGTERWYVIPAGQGGG